MTEPVAVRVVGDGPLRAALDAAGVDVTDAEDAALVQLVGAVQGVDAVEDALAGWVAQARRAAAEAQHVVSVVGRDLLYGDDPAALAVGHGVVAATRAYAMEGARGGCSAAVLVTDDTPEAADRAAAWIRLAVHTGPPGGDVVHLGAAPHGKLRP